MLFFTCRSSGVQSSQLTGFGGLKIKTQQTKYPLQLPSRSPRAAAGDSGHLQSHRSAVRRWSWPETPDSSTHVPGLLLSWQMGWWGGSLAPARAGWARRPRALAASVPPVLPHGSWVTEGQPTDRAAGAMSPTHTRCPLCGRDSRWLGDTCTPPAPMFTGDLDGSCRVQGGC